MSAIRILPEFYSAPEGIGRTLRICTPDGYDGDPDSRFPVLYMLDGQNVFNHPASAVSPTWRANDAMDRLSAEGLLRPWIIVAVDHTPDRLAEYSPWKEPAAGSEGRGWLFADFLVHHLKPYIDTAWRTLPEPHWTAVMGSSMGGLMSLVLGKAYPHVFGRIGALSPTVMWANGELYRLWDAPTGRWCRIYLDTGALETYWFDDIYLDYVEATGRFCAHLKEIGVKDHELRYVVAPGHFHNEQAWQERLPDIFPWLLEEPQGI